MIRKFDELTYYSKLLSKLQHKKYEFYVISRIIHLLNDTEIQFTTQQVVRKTDGKRYIIDLYFPQFKLAVEVDENYHDSQIETDKLREREVIAYTEAEIVRICCNHQASLKTVHSDIDNLVEKIRQLKLETKDFVPYSYSDEFSVEKWLKLGTISTTSDAKFLTHTDVLKLFGKDFTKHQRAISPLKKGKMIRYKFGFQNYIKMVNGITHFRLMELIFVKQELTILKLRSEILQNIRLYLHIKKMFLEILIIHLKDYLSVLNIQKMKLFIKELILRLNFLTIITKYLKYLLFFINSL